MEKRKLNIKQYSMVIALLAIVLAFAVLTQGKILRPMNVSNVIFQNSYVVILGVGMLLCILTGGNIDLSVGSIVALVGACAGEMLVKSTWNPYVAIAVCLLIGTACGAWQAFWIAYVKIPPFIVTLSGMLVFRGLTLLILNGLTLAPFPQEYLMFSTGYIPSPFIEKITLFNTQYNFLSLLVGAVCIIALVTTSLLKRNKKLRKGYPAESLLSLVAKLALISIAIAWFFLTIGKFRGIPTVLIIIGLVVISYGFFTSNMVQGRYLYSMGGNMKAAKLSGIKTERMMFFAYTNMGFLAAVAGLVFAARLNSASPQAGLSFELDAIGACFIGGASAYGGIGTVGGTVIGALIFGVLNNGMSIMGINSNVQQIVKGLVLLGAVAFDVIGKMNIQLFPKRK
ncbi:MAG: multiple monosaccharide ABC transporter permease [Eubacteriales bacterium]|nr:multiple monosaccharide ABC transporter permease [Eubacteriales bacterium]